ncbi:hypothetical protein RUND412_009311 [Rhizina undulata]
MFAANTSDSTVESSNNRVVNSGNTINVTNIFNFHASTNASGTQDSTRNDFEEFNVPINLPYHKNPNFCGRTKIIETSHQFFHPRDASESSSGSESKTVILHGMGGVGKFQIALEYAHRFSDCYTSIFWIDADKSRTNYSAFKVLEKLVDHYATKWRTSPDFPVIGNILGIPEKFDDSGTTTQSVTEAAMKAVHKWLRKKENRGWLLLIDNRDTVDYNFNELHYNFSIIESAGRGTVHRGRSNWGRRRTCVDIEEFWENNQNLEKSKLAEAKEIVATLGELPLALEQAAAYIPSRQILFAVYRTKLEEGMEIVFKNGLQNPSLSSVKASVFTTWGLAFQELRDDARQLLHLFAFLSHEDIPDELFRREAVD